MGHYWNLDNYKSVSKLSFNGRLSLIFPRNEYYILKLALLANILQYGGQFNLLQKPFFILFGVKNQFKNCRNLKMLKEILKIILWVQKYCLSTITAQSLKNPNFLQFYCNALSYYKLNLVI